jgi:hypothetical protein
MNNRNVLVSSLLALSLAVAPATSALADGHRHGGYRGGEPIWHLTSAIVGTAVAAITLPIVIAATIAGVPAYEDEGPGYPPSYPPGYAPGPAGYAAPPGGGYYGPPQAPIYYAPAPPARYYAPYGAAPYYPRPHAYYAPPRPAYYGRRPGDYAPSRGSRYDGRR